MIKYEKENQSRSQSDDVSYRWDRQDRGGKDVTQSVLKISKYRY
jgi:hypothetical protein